MAGTDRSDDGTVIDLPNPALVILIGLQGSGKSTLARKHFAPMEILSTDELRARMCNDPASQSNSRPARDHLVGLLHQRMLNRVTTVVDSTNIRSRQRAELLAAAHHHAVPAVAILLNIPVELCRGRIAQRARIIRDDVLENHAAQWPQVLTDVAGENYQSVHILTDREVLDTHFRHARPVDPDPDRWVEVEQLAPITRTLRFPADEIRRHPLVLAMRDPTTVDYAHAAAEHAHAPPPARPSELNVVFRVRLPHCHPITLTNAGDAWRQPGSSTVARIGAGDEQATLKSLDTEA